MKYVSLKFVSCVSFEVVNNVDRKMVKVFKNRPSEICGRQPLKNLK